MDIKLASFMSGVSEMNNERAKQFARHIRDHYKDTKLSLRWVLVKDMTDTDDEIEALAAFAKELSHVFTHIELLPYHVLLQLFLSIFHHWYMRQILCLV